MAVKHARWGLRRDQTYRAAHVSALRTPEAAQERHNAGPEPRESSQHRRMEGEIGPRLVPANSPGDVSSNQNIEKA